MGGNFIKITLLAVFLTSFSSGCFTKTIYVPPGKSVMLRQDVKNVKIWAKDSEGKRVPGKITLKNGWFVVPQLEKE